MPELTTVEIVRDWLGADSEEDARIGRALASVETKMKAICHGRSSFLTGSYTDTFNGEGWDSITLKHTPIDTGETLTVSVILSSTSSMTLETASYRVDARTGILRLIETPTSWFTYGIISSVPGTPGFGFPDSFRNIQAVYTGGYDADAIPADLADIAVRWTAAVYRGREADPSVVRERLGNHDIQYTTGENAGDMTASFKQELYEGGYAFPCG